VALALPEHVAFERRWRRVQRVGRVVIVLGLLAALVGVFGTGPLAHATARAPGGRFAVQYDRFLRTTQTSQLTIDSTPTGHTGRIAISSAYTAATELSDVVPQPDSETATGGRIVLVYQGSLPSQVQLGITPETIGVHRATIWVDGARTGFRQLTWP
jgi:hypothetical protein